MKYLTSNPGAALSRVALFFCTAVILTTTVGCGGARSWHPFASDEPDWKARTDFLETKVDRIRVQMERERDQSERADFWRITSVLLVLLVFFALVGGAALGSRARRDRLGIGELMEQEKIITHPQNEVVC